MKHRIFTRLLCIFVAICLLAGCNYRIDPPQAATKSTKPTEPTESSEPTEPSSHAPQPTQPMPDVPFDAAAHADAKDFTTIEYVRPDVEALIAQADALTETVSSGTASAEELLDALYALDIPYNEYVTMDSVAYIRYCLNLSDSYYETEYNYLESQDPIVQAATERLSIACANSPHKDALEEYFGEDYLDFYVENRVYTNDAVVTLSQRESQLETEYMSLQDAPKVTFEGQEWDLDALMEEYAEDYGTLYDQIFPAYYQQYNEKCGKIFVEMVKVRQEMAREAGFDSYPEFMFRFYYDRDYTPDQARQYVTELRQELLPIYQSAQYALTYEEEMDMDTAAQTLAKSLYAMEPDYYEHFQFMEHFQLWDATASPSKMPGSYQTYLPSYSEPFVYISPTGTERDYLTLAHEFGHFIDSMENDGEDINLEQCETFSQSMEFLTLFYCDLPDDTVEAMKINKLIDLLQVFLYQGAYAEFEDRVYQLEEPTLEAINQIYEQVMEEYEMLLPGMDWYNQLTWIDINHFFIAPCYVISYCVSADPALQVFQLEQEQAGAGVDAYAGLLDNTLDHTLSEMLDACGLVSPFQPGRAKELAQLFQSCLS